MIVKPVHELLPLCRHRVRTPSLALAALVALAPHLRSARSHPRARRPPFGLALGPFGPPVLLLLSCPLPNPIALLRACPRSPSQPFLAL